MCWAETAHGAARFGPVKRDRAGGATGHGRIRADGGLQAGVQTGPVWIGLAGRVRTLGGFGLRSKVRPGQEIGWAGLRLGVSGFRS